MIEQLPASLWQTRLVTLVGEIGTTLRLPNNLDMTAAEYDALKKRIQKDN